MISNIKVKVKKKIVCERRIWAYTEKVLKYAHMPK
jgi:hypothetical protein